MGPNQPTEDDLNYRNIPEFSNLEESIFLGLPLGISSRSHPLASSHPPLLTRIYAANFGYEISIRCDTHFCVYTLNTEIESKELNLYFMHNSTDHGHRRKV